MEPLRTKDYPLKKRVDDFLNQWHELLVDYWWRKKYNVPFGSPLHRSMSPIDMVIEYHEEQNLQRIIRATQILRNGEEEEEIRRLHGADTARREEVVAMSQDEIDHDFDTLDFSQFNK